GDAAQPLEAGAQIVHGAWGARDDGALEQAAGHLPHQLGKLLLQPEALHRFGDLANRALVIERLAARLVAHEAGRLRDPDALARLVAVDLRDEVDHLAVAFQDALEVGATLRLDIPFARDVA